MCRLRVPQPSNKLLPRIYAHRGSYLLGAARGGDDFLDLRSVAGNRLPAERLFSVNRRRQGRPASTGQTAAHCDADLDGPLRQVPVRDRRCDADLDLMSLRLFVPERTPPKSLGQSNDQRHQNWVPSVSGHLPLDADDPPQNQTKRRFPNRNLQVPQASRPSLGTISF